MTSALMEHFAEMRTQRIKQRYRKFLKESQWKPDPKLVHACAENASYFKTGVPELSQVSIPLILRYQVSESIPPVMELVLLQDIHRSNQGDILHGYSVLHDRMLHYRADAMKALYQGVDYTPLASLDHFAARYRPCMATGHAMLRAELHALLYLALQDSVIQPSEIEVVKAYLARKALTPAMQQAFLHYFLTSFVTPNAYGDVVETLRQLTPKARIALLDTGAALIDANGAISSWERAAFEELLTLG